MTTHSRRWTPEEIRRESGTYELPGSDGETTVAVKIIDMLGEEVLVRQSV